MLFICWHGKSYGVGAQHTLNGESGGNGWVCIGYTEAHHIMFEGHHSIVSCYPEMV